jgi:hypothetical protein
VLEAKPRTIALLIAAVLLAATVLAPAAAAEATLAISPDHRDSLWPGGSTIYSFYAKLDGDTGEVVELGIPPEPAGWSLSLNDVSGATRLTDTDGDHIPDLGYVVPGEPCWFTLMVRSPTAQAGDTASLDSARLFVAGYLGRHPVVTDTAFLTIVRPPEDAGLSVHNFPNPLTIRTAFIVFLPVDGRLSLTVYTRAGERVCRVLDRENKKAGTNVLVWEAENDHGQQVAPGTYD